MMIQSMTGCSTGRVNRDIQWVRAEELEQYKFCPADVEVAEILRKVSNDDA